MPKWLNVMKLTIGSIVKKLMSWKENCMNNNDQAMMKKSIIYGKKFKNLKKELQF